VRTPLGWHLIEANELTLVAEPVAERADVLEIDVYPVIEDTDSGAASKEGLRNVAGPFRLSDR
jgi:hypothetical protein